MRRREPLPSCQTRCGKNEGGDGARLKAGLGRDFSAGDQLSDGRSSSSTGTFTAASFSPSFSCNALKMDGPGTASGGGATGSPDFVRSGWLVGSGVYWSETSNRPSIPVRFTTVAPSIVERAPANWLMEALLACKVMSPEGVLLNSMPGSSTGGGSFGPLREVTRA